MLNTLRNLDLSEQEVLDEYDFWLIENDDLGVYKYHLYPFFQILLIYIFIKSVWYFITLMSKNWT
jgi:hypothetical protein